jgi:hypothetical protein
MSSRSGADLLADACVVHQNAGMAEVQCASAPTPDQDKYCIG